MTHVRLSPLTAAAFALFAVSAAGARAADVQEFYKGRSISLVIGYSAGSGYDLYARLLARFIGKYIPGNPAVVAQNMPGAGSLKAALYMHNVAARDGGVIATIGRSAPLEPLLSDSQFDGRNSPGSAASPAIRACASTGTRAGSRPGRTRWRSRSHWPAKAPAPTRIISRAFSKICSAPRSNW